MVRFDAVGFVFPRGVPRARHLILVYAERGRGRVERTLDPSLSKLERFVPGRHL